MTYRHGVALCASLYRKNTTLWLRGELGAGKTTFVQGLGVGLDIGNAITSPTYALENRYDETLLHLDLYRLDEAEARRVSEASEDFPGVRAIEWSEKLSDEEGRDIDIAIEESSETGRKIIITFSDLIWPDRKTIEQWRKDVRLPEHICKHCDAVGSFSKVLAKELLHRGIPCRPEAVRTAGELHDLLRFVDFHPGGGQNIPHAQKADEETVSFWETFKKTHPGDHEEACANFLTEHGYAEFSEIIRPHGLSAIIEAPESIHTIEQKILFYADKRIRMDEVVSLDERFDDFAQRYGNGKESDWGKRARARTKTMEEELFGNDVPYYSPMNPPA